jgi:hypothetical protein
LKAGFTFLDPALKVPMFAPTTQWLLVLALAFVAFRAIRLR